MTKEIMMSEATTNDLIQAALDMNYNKANEVFGEIMSLKLDDVLDQEKINLAAQVYNGVDPDGEEDYDGIVGDDEEVADDDDGSSSDEEWEESDASEDGYDSDIETESDVEEEEEEED